MSGIGPTDQSPQDSAGSPGPATVSPAVARANRMSAANMLRSLLPLVVICLLLVGWQSLQEKADEGVRVVDPTSAIQLAAARAIYPMPAPVGLADGYRPTSARTDAGKAEQGDPVTLEIGYLTPSDEYAGFVVSDDPRAGPITAVLDGARKQGNVDIGGATWARCETQKGETALVREADGVIVAVTGSASQDELEEVAAAVRPYRD
jgi:uncharacterized protein DUF4245